MLLAETHMLYSQLILLQKLRRVSIKLVIQLPMRACVGVAPQHQLSGTTLMSFPYKGSGSLQTR
jgi:hypothetical protein